MCHIYSLGSFASHSYPANDKATLCLAITVHVITITNINNSQPASFNEDQTINRLSQEVQLKVKQMVTCNNVAVISATFQDFFFHEESYLCMLKKCELLMERVE